MANIFHVRIPCPTRLNTGKTEETLNSEAISQKIVFETDQLFMTHFSLRCRRTNPRYDDSTNQIN